MKLKNYLIICTKSDIVYGRLELRNYESFTRGLDRIFEICYWERCWGIKDNILNNILHVPDTSGTFKITHNQLQQIIDLFKSFNSKNWSEGNNIWTYGEIKRKLMQDIREIKWLIKYLQNKPEIEIYFINELL